MFVRSVVSFRKRLHIFFGCKIMRVFLQGKSQIFDGSWRGIMMEFV